MAQKPNSAISARARQRALRGGFVSIQIAKAAIGAVLAIGFVATAGRPDAWEWAALGGLVFPALLALLSLTRIPLGLLEQLSLASFAALVAYLAVLTGGTGSPIIVWLVLVPAEAALAGERPAVLRAAGGAAVALAAVAALQAFGLLPPSRLPAPVWEFYVVSLLAAVMQAGFIAAAAQERQRAADQAAAEGAAMYRFLAENAMDLITRHGSDGRIRFASPAARMLLGIEPETLEGVAPAALVHPDDLRAIQAAFMESSYFGRAASAEIRLKRADATYVWAEMRCRPAAAQASKAADIVAVTRDISERKNHERALIEARDLAEQANRAKSSFLANMSHELRTPLNAILGFSEVMTHEMFGPVGSPRYLEYSRLIHESGAHLLELINGILDMSKIEAGKFELSEEIFDLEEAAQSCMRFVRQPAERGGIALKLAIAPAARTIFADKRAIKQVLVNLLSNGVKFTPRGGEVRITAALDSRGIELAVSDSGVGIARKDLDRLGRPFEQVEGEHVRAKEGTGLGLALVKALAAMHGGEATIESALGVGTTVRVRLPYAAVDDSGARVAPGETKIIPFKGAA
ncbi:MAG: PAS domain S-box protein [Alphaproteobacteria bacterium]|nr:PAS domain S-box protein [Alphaproteobacteria bacterium]MBV9694382.1 PAS domain S-box protein [Alphaproteobacteria bacterium]